MSWSPRGLRIWTDKRGKTDVLEECGDSPSGPGDSTGVQERVRVVEETLVSQGGDLKGPHHIPG